jgi:hypothetical protein
MTGDTLNFVIFDSDVTTVFANGDLSEDGKADLVRMVRRVRAGKHHPQSRLGLICLRNNADSPGSATNLLGGLERGVELLRSTEATSVRRVFLFSDGEVNVGVRDEPSILSAVDRYSEEGITVSTFGIGRDFDESLMTKIAHHGKGTFEFLDRPEDITSQVSKSVHGLLNITGFDAVLKVSALNEFTVSSIAQEGGDDDRDCASMDAVNLGDLHSGNTRQVLVQLLPPRSASNLGSLPALAYELSFAPADGGPRVHVASGTASVENVQNEGEQSSPSVEVVAAVAIHEAAAHDDTAAELLACGQNEDAFEMKRRSLARLQVALDVSRADGSNEAVQMRLSRLLEKGQGTLARMEEDSQSARLTLQCEAMRMRRLSVDDIMVERMDSDAGNWSDEEDDRNALVHRGWSGSDSGSDSDSDDIDGLSAHRTPRRQRSRSRSPERRCGRSISPPVYTPSRGRSISPPIHRPTAAGGEESLDGTRSGGKQKNCAECQQPFSIFKWRHSCRRCQRVVCAQCSDSKVALTNATARSSTPQRVCTVCSAALNSKLPSDAGEVAAARCPITHERMVDPVIAADGFSYEREAITKWLQTSRVSPMTGAELSHRQVVPNHALRWIIDANSE